MTSEKNSSKSHRLHQGLLWLALVDLRQAWLRLGLTAFAIALAILAVAFFGKQIDLRQAEVLTGYEEAGAATFIADLSDVADTDVDALADAVRGLSPVSSVAAPYSGIALGIIADTSFLVYQNEQQQEYLGARTNVLGVDRSFDLARDYYVNFHTLNRSPPQSVLGIRLQVTQGAARAPEPGELLVASVVADYVGVRPSAPADVELFYTGVEPPVVQRFQGLRLMGTFDLAGPDEGRFDPFWRLAGQGQDVLTIRRPDAAEAPVTTLPIVLNVEVVREFLASVQRELNARGLPPPRRPQRDQLVVRAKSIAEVPSAEVAVQSLLQQRGLGLECNVQRARSFCLRLPERNNFQAAVQEKNKVGAGGVFFVALLLALVATGTAGLQVQTVLARWHDYGVLQALGFSPHQIIGYFGLQLMFVLFGGIVLAVLASVLLASVGAVSVASFASAAGVSVMAACVTAAPVLIWPLSRSPAELLREAA